MARTIISPTYLGGGSSAQVKAAEFTWTAADTVNGNRFATPSGKAMLFARNTNADSPAVSYTVTLYGTYGQIEKSLDSLEYACFGQIPVTGWEQGSESYVWLDGSNAELEFAVLLLP